MSGLKLNDVVKRYGATQVIHGVDLDIEDGEFCVFVGPSGCGKSTLLRMVAGLEETTGGRIAIGGRDVTHLDPAERGLVRSAGEPEWRFPEDYITRLRSALLERHEK